MVCVARQRGRTHALWGRWTRLHQLPLSFTGSVTSGHSHHDTLQLESPGTVPSKGSAFHWFHCLLAPSSSYRMGTIFLLVTLTRNWRRGKGTWSRSNSSFKVELELEPKGSKLWLSSPSSYWNPNARVPVNKVPVNKVPVEQGTFSISQQPYEVCVMHITLIKKGLRAKKF